MNMEYRDIGDPLAGRCRVVEGGADLTSAGEDVWGTNDQFGFLSQKASGDFELVARLQSLQACHHYTKAGLMAREGYRSDAAHVLLLAFPTVGPRNNNSGLVEAQYRPSAGAECTAIYPPGRGTGEPEFPLAFPQVWLNLARRGDEWTFRVGDGRTWQTYSVLKLPLARTLEVGLAFTSHEGSTLGVAEFRDVSLV